MDNNGAYSGRVSDALAALARFASLPEVAAHSERARLACTDLRWHQALRRRIPEASAESRIRGAWASAELDGARSSIAIVRDLMRGALPRSPDPDPTERVLYGAIAATAATEELGSLAAASPRQALARLHLAAAAHLVPHDELGRPRSAAQVCREFVELDPPPAPEVVAARLAMLDDIIASDLPALLVAAIAHAEVVHLRPFTRGNGLVARAYERALIHASGLDPTGVAVPEHGHGAESSAAYHGALTAYGQGSSAGVTLWVKHCADALVAGAKEGAAIADAVLAGRLT